jgi:cell division protein FtsQ
MSAVAAPADKRFRRAHVKPSRRRRWRTLVRPVAKSSIAVLLLVFGLYRGGVMVAHARALQVDRIVVRGNAQLSTDAVVALLGGLHGQNILRTDLADWRSRLLASPWVKDAALRRVLPSTVEVVVQERQPIGLGRIRGVLYLVDEQGLVIDTYGPQYAQFDLPIVDGLSNSPRTAGAAADGARAELAARLILSLRANPEVGGRLSQVDVRNPHNAGVILSGDPTLLYVGTDRFLARIQAYLELAAAMNERVPGIDSVDLRFDDLIYARVAERSAAAGRGANAARQATPSGRAAEQSGAKKQR